MTRQILTPTQRRALSAAAGLVGLPHLRAGLAMTLAVACVPLDEPGQGSSDTSTTSPATGDAASTDGPVTTGASASGALTEGEASGSTGGGSDGGSDGSTGTTGEGTTLLTDASTSHATTGGTSGDDTTGDDTTGDTGTTGTTGTLDDCMDPRTGEVDWACCEAQNWEPHPQCTPWGPPAPPVVDAAAMDRARAARGRWV